MDADRFDAITKNLSAGNSRRRLLGVFLGTALTGLVEYHRGEAKPEHKRRHARSDGQGKQKHKDKHRHERSDEKAKKKDKRARGEDVVNGCVEFCNLLFPARFAKEKNRRCLQAAEQHPEFCNCLSFCRRVYHNDKRKLLACLHDAFEGGGICAECGADPDRFCNGACCPLPGQCDGERCQVNQDPCANNPCPPLDQCHEAGTCDSTTGICSNLAKTNGTPCNDGNSCTVNDTCQAGVCTLGQPVVCTASDQCHIPGTCDPATGQCSNLPKPDGSACDDDDPCTTADSCHNGSCVGGSPFICPSPQVPNTDCSACVCPPCPYPNQVQDASCNCTCPSVGCPGTLCRNSVTCACSCDCVEGEIREQCGDFCCRPADAHHGADVCCLEPGRAWCCPTGFTCRAGGQCCDPNRGPCS